MLLDFSPIAATILFAWLLHLIVAFNFKNRSSRILAYYQGLWKTLAYVGIVLALLEILHIATSVMMGFIWEEFAFNARFYGFWFWWMLRLDVFAPWLFCLNFWPKLRNNLGFRSFQLLIILVILLIRMALTYHQGISIIPGWHTTVDVFSFPLTLLIAGVSIFWLNRRWTKAEKI